MRFRLDPTPTEGGNGNGNTTTTETTKTEATTTAAATTTKSDGFEALAAKHSSDGVGLARNLWDQLQAANAKVTELTGKIAPEGAVILKGDQAKAWAKFNSLGKPEDLETRLNEGAAAIGKVAKHDREKHVGEVAKLVGFDADVLNDLAGTLEFEIAEETVKGKVEKVVKVKDGETSKPLAEYAAAKWPKYMPALKLSTTPAGPKLGTPPSRPIAGRIGQTAAAVKSESIESETPVQRPRLIPFGTF